MKDFVLGNGGTKAPPYKGYGLCPTRCNTNAKLAIKQKGIFVEVLWIKIF